MVNVDSVCVCRCGEEFPSERQLETHVYEPFGSSQDNPQAISPQLPALAE